MAATDERAADQGPALLGGGLFIAAAKWFAAGRAFLACTRGLDTRIVLLGLPCRWCVEAPFVEMTTTTKKKKRELGIHKYIWWNIDDIYVANHGCLI